MPAITTAVAHVKRRGRISLSDLGFGNLPSYYTSSYSVGLAYNLSYSTLLGPSQAKAQRRATHAFIRIPS